MALPQKITTDTDTDGIDIPRIHARHWHVLRDSVAIMKDRLAKDPSNEGLQNELVKLEAKMDRHDNIIKSFPAGETARKFVAETMFKRDAQQ
jgi:hypothetical protein